MLEGRGAAERGEGWRKRCFHCSEGECRAIKFKLWFKMNRDYRVVPDENRDSA